VTPERLGAATRGARSSSARESAAQAEMIRAALERSGEAALDAEIDVVDRT
jgi:hypothetical protein